MILERLIALICEELGLEKEIGEETVIGDLIDDEIEVQELIIAIENEFGAELDCGAGITVGELADLLEV